MPSHHARRVGYLLAMQDDPRERALCAAQMVMYDVHRTRASGGTYLAVFEDNSCAYHKRHDQLNSENVDAFGHNKNTPPLHECAAWHFAKALGPQYERLLPVTVYRKHEDRWGSLAAELPGVKPAGAAFSGAPEQVNDAGFFDLLIGQQDRHLNNSSGTPRAAVSACSITASPFPPRVQRTASAVASFSGSGATSRSRSPMRRPR